MESENKKQFNAVIIVEGRDDATLANIEEFLRFFM